MTTITTGTTGPKAWKIALVAGAVGLATLVVANLPLSTSDTTDLPATDAQAVTAESAATRGSSAVPDQATIDGLTPAITQEFLDGNAASTGVEGGNRVDLQAATAAGLNPGAIDQIVGGTTSSAVPDQVTIDGLAPVITQEFVSRSGAATGISDAATNARWEALARAYENGTISTYYTGELNPTVAVNARLEALSDAYETTYYTGGPGPGAAVNARWAAVSDAYANGTISSYYLRAAVAEEPHVPMANNQLR